MARTFTQICFATLALAATASAATCVTGYHIIVARAAGELPGEGSTGTIANDITARVPSSDSVGLNYLGLPAPFDSLSETQGTKQLHSDLTSYVQSCPNAKIVLLGYDLGASVIGDVLGGAGVNATNPVQGVEAAAVKGVVLFSDPSHVAGQPYDVGTSTTNATHPRSPASVQNLLKYQDILRSYCDAGDTSCASGTNSSVNRQYLSKYEQAATDFIVNLYE